MLHGMALDNQFHLFIQITKNNSIKIMKMDKDCNDFHWLWLKLGIIHITLKMFEWFKPVEICMVQVLGFIEDKQCFNTVVFMKTKVHKLIEHPYTCVWTCLGRFKKKLETLFNETIVIEKKHMK